MVLVTGLSLDLFHFSHANKSSLRCENAHNAVNEQSNFEGNFRVFSRPFLITQLLKRASLHCTFSARVKLEQFPENSNWPMTLIVDKALAMVVIKTLVSSLLARLFGSP